MNQTLPYVIETHNLSKTYKNIRALNALELKVHQNSIFGFLGPNGAGKTTTIKLMLGLTRPICRYSHHFWHGQRIPECFNPRPHRLPAPGTPFL